MPKNNYDVIIIGAGVAGLTSALYLAAAGKKVLVIERQATAGGVASSFKRNVFTFESVLHYVDSLGQQGEMRDFLNQHKVSDKLQFIEIKEFGRIIYPQHNFVIGNSLNALKLLLLFYFPDQRIGIEKFFIDISKFYRELNHYSASKSPEWLKLLASPFVYPAIIKTSCLTLEQFITRKIKDEKLRAIIGTIWGFLGLPPSQISAFYFLIVLRGCWMEPTAFIKGGFSQLFQAMAKRAVELGAEFKFNTTVEEILVDRNNHVVGVRLPTSEEFNASVVISNANAIDTLTKLVNSETIKIFYRQKLTKMQKSLSATQLYLGLNISLKSLGMIDPLMYINTAYQHNQSFDCCLHGDYKNCNLFIVNHSQIDNDLAAPGKSSLCIMTLDSYANWDKLNEEEYQKRKKEFADIIIARIEKYLPGLSSHIEVLEVATPKTMQRFANLPEGAIYGFTQIVAQTSISRLGHKTKVKGLILAGAWTQPGSGVHGCFISGREAGELAVRLI